MGRVRYAVSRLADAAGDGIQGDDARWSAGDDVDLEDPDDGPLDMLGNDRWIADGINSAGLVVGLLYHPGFATYPDYDPANASQSLAPLDVAPYLLTQCTSIAEVREAMAGVRVVPVVVDAIGMPPPVHFIVVEPSGQALVIEFAGETRFFDNPLRVMTNAPTFDWHEIHLRNFVNLSATSMPSRELASLDFSPIGVGSGMLGLPGDFTPPSRFVRAVAWSQTKRTTGDADEGVYEVFRELDNFNVPLGMAEGSDSSAKRSARGTPMTQSPTSSSDVTSRFQFHLSTSPSWAHLRRSGKSTTELVP